MLWAVVTEVGSAPRGYPTGGLPCRNHVPGGAYLANMVRNASVAESGTSGYLADDEIVHRITTIDAAAAVRLHRMAAIYAHGTEWSPDDLLQEAFVAALERRQWRADLDTVVFLNGVMRSLAHANRKHRKVSALDRTVAGGEDHQQGLEEIPGGEGTDPAEISEAD